MRRGTRWLALALSLWLLGAASAYAAPVTVSEGIRIESDQNNIQIIAKGDAGKPFEANLELPDGTIYEHEQYDAGKVLYLKMDTGERRWLINVAPKGEYKLHLTGEAQGYQLSLKTEQRKPVTEWVSPSNTTIPSGSGSLSLTWKTEGDYDADDDIRFFLKPANGWQDMLLGEASLGSGQAVIALPGTLADGEYGLYAIADNKTPDGQMLDPKVKIIVSGGTDGDGPRLIDVAPQGEEVSLEFEAPRSMTIIEASAQFTDAAGAATERTSALADLYELEPIEGSDTRSYRWTLPLPEGTYNGRMQLQYENGAMSGIVAIPEFELARRDWTKDTITWSIESEKTNAQQLQITLALQAETRVQVVDSADGILYDKLMGPADDERSSETISVPLTEGDHFVELLLQDNGGALTSFSKRYLIDRTPPLLTMIQPQANHKQLKDGIASGFTDTDSVVIYKGTEYAPDEAGYFRIDDVGSSLQLTVRDSHGNETSYSWEASGGWSKAWMTFILINALLLIATVVLIYWIRRNAKSKPKS